MYKRELKATRSELDQRADHPYYVGGSGGVDADDKVDDDDPVLRQQRARDWAAADDPAKVS